MADILIRGMEMPKTCEDCPLVEETENYYGDTMSMVCNLIYKGYTSEAPKGRRRSDCPLVPIPEGHGRLGDLDELETTVIDAIEKGFNAVDILLDIRFAPTIIEAEGKNADGN